jgi:hypothetical protein
VAHLLTGRIDLAEGATLEAINAWKPDIESDEVLLRYGVAAALRKRERLDACGLNKDNGTHSFLPAELRTVLELRPALRRSFVRRLLAGFSLEDSAELLRSSERVDRAARAAVRAFCRQSAKLNARGERIEH